MTDFKYENVWRPALLTSVAIPFVGLVVMFFAISTNTTWTTLTDVLRRATIGWLFATGSSVQQDGVTIGVIPIGFVAMWGMATYMFAHWAVRNDDVDFRAFGAVVAGFSALIAATLSIIVSNDDVAVPVFRAAFQAFLVPGISAAFAASHRAERTWLSLPERFRPAAEGAAATLMVFFALSTVILVVLLATSLDESAHLWATLHPEGTGLGLALLLILAVPTAVFWVSAVLLGVPVNLGGSSYVSLAVTDVEIMPAFPIFTAIPNPGPHAHWVFFLTFIPILCGAFGGFVFRRLTYQNIPWKRCLQHSAGLGAAAGLVAGILIWTSTGGLGTGRLQSVGPPVFLTGVIAVVVFTLGAVLGASITHYRLTREPQRF